MASVSARNLDILLYSAPPAWQARLAGVAGSHGGLVLRCLEPGAACAGEIPRAVLVFRAAGGALAGCPAAPGCAERWLIQADPAADRDAAFAAGFTEILPESVSDRELAWRLSRLETGTDLADGLAAFARVSADEIGGPLQALGLGQAAIRQELEALRPLFEDLHKAWFTGSQALLERLRLILGVINLQDSWARLEHTAADFGSGIERLARVQSILAWQAAGEPADETPPTIQETVGTCLSLLSESAGPGIGFANHLAAARTRRLPGRLFFASLLTALVGCLDLLKTAGGGRGLLEIRDMASDPDWQERRALRNGDWAPDSLVIRLRADRPLDGAPPVWAGGGEQLWARLGIATEWRVHPDAAELALWLRPAPPGQGGGG